MTVQRDFDAVDAFTVGAVGKPGQRVFYLQARSGGEWVTIKCEKQQVAAIADHLTRLLSDLPAPNDRPVDSAMQFVDSPNTVFILGPVGLGYDRSGDRLLVQLEEVIEVDEDGEPVQDDDERGRVRVHLTRAQAAAFCQHAGIVVAAGRPPCRWCTGPVDPDGHACPRMN
ncbi:MAG TPA: DUF3090 family protein [Ilumatobacteraceae bacterium]|nr:DUF3090 family protein [Ilumatobacteraceae bacterium]